MVRQEATNPLADFNIRQNPAKGLKLAYRLCMLCRQSTLNAGLHKDSCKSGHGCNGLRIPVEGFQLQIMWSWRR